jgi:DNA repair protein RecN (Recombination protein N)
VIHELRISGLGVIAEATCRFAPGFTAVTGETGAGKTMVVSGLGLLAGGKADPGLVRVGADQAVVEGLLDAPGAAAAALVTEAGGVIDDDGLTAARIIAARGRSVLGGRGVPTALLSEVMGQLLVIHGQHDQTRIGSRSLALLDAFAGPDTQALAAEVAHAHGLLRGLERELDELRTTERERARELDLLEFSLAEIATIDPQPDEDIALSVESERLANADSLVGAAHTAREALTSEADLDGSTDAMSLLSEARRALEAAAEHDQALAEPAAAIRSAMAQLGDVAADLSQYVQDIDADPRRLAAVQDRRADLARLTRKYGSSVAEVLQWSATAATRVAQLAGADDRIQSLEAEVAELRDRSGQLCARLRVQRLAAADRFAEEIAAELGALAMPRARVAFTVTTTAAPDGIVLPDRPPARPSDHPPAPAPAQPPATPPHPSAGPPGEARDADWPTGPVAFRATGVDDVALMLAANPGAPLRPIAQAASGGELSRVMLAVQVVLAGADPVPTMVFDEVDAGVGGAAAIEVGRRLQGLSTRTQVIVVTHLAQVAAFADRHLVVTKDSDGAVTESSVRAVVGEERTRELSRMLAGLADSEAAGAHADELLDLAHRASRA